MTAGVYLDYNATAPLRPEAAEAVGHSLAVIGNPSSVHRFGRLARRLLDEARAEVAALVGAAPEQIVFTSGGTEANALALSGTGRRRLLVSAGEHDSVLAAAPGAQCIPLEPDGRVDLAALDAALAKDETPALVSVMLANNETGVIQPLGEVVARARAHGALVHCDAVQAAGKIPLDFGELGVDLLTLSAHKLGGPQGVGALVVSSDREITPLIRGGGQEHRRRAGTENLPGIVGFGAAARAAASLAGMERLAAWRDALERRITALAPEAVVFGRGAPRLPNTSCLALPGLAAETQVMALDLAGVAVSAGSACSSGKVAPSHVLRAMGASEAEASSAIRVSFGWASDAGDVESFLAAWGELYSRKAPALGAASPAA
ncbi:MAG TPA: cysteine desulfurase family protein [Kiloniellales bacterium]|nr:cysteine desulfurase family protein [Kiloniellales bacterium]